MYFEDSLLMHNYGMPSLFDSGVFKATENATTSISDYWVPSLGRAPFCPEELYFRPNIIFQNLRELNMVNAIDSGINNLEILSDFIGRCKPGLKVVLEGFDGLSNRPLEKLNNKKKSIWMRTNGIPGYLSNDFYKIIKNLPHQGNNKYLENADHIQGALTYIPRQEREGEDRRFLETWNPVLSAISAAEIEDNGSWILGNCDLTRAIDKGIPTNEHHF